MKYVKVMHSLDHIYLTLLIFQDTLIRNFEFLLTKQILKCTFISIIIINKHKQKDQCLF